MTRDVDVPAAERETICVDFKWASPPTGGEPAAARLLARVAAQLEARGVAVGRVGPGKGVEAAFMIEAPDTAITVIAGQDDETWWFVQAWESPRPWWRRRRVQPPAAPGSKGTLQGVADVLRLVLEEEPAVTEARWMSAGERAAAGNALSSEGPPKGG